MSNSLTSHEDLTPYVEELTRLSMQTQSGLERRRSFAADPETIIKELLTEVMTCRKNTQRAENIAKKFLEAYNTGLEDQSRLKQKIHSLGSDIGELNSLVQKYQKEIEVKNDRYENLTIEATDMERALKSLNSEISHLRKEREALKKEIQNKEQSIIVRETTMQQRKNLFQEVEKEKVKEKEKEIDKELKVRNDQLTLLNKKQLSEISDLKSRIEEVEELWTLDKKEFDKSKNLINGLRDELTGKKLEYEKIYEKYREAKDRIIELKEELMMQKAHNDSLVREYDRQKSTSFKAEFEGVEEGIKNERFSRSKTEILGDFLEDFNQDKEMFLSIGKDASSPRFILVNNKKIEVLEGISIESEKPQSKLELFKGVKVKNTAQFQAIENIEIKQPGNSKIEGKKNMKKAQVQVLENIRIINEGKKINKSKAQIQSLENIRIMHERKNITKKAQIQSIENFGIIKVNQSKSEGKNTAKKAQIETLENFSIKQLNLDKLEKKKMQNKAQIQVLENFGITYERKNNLRKAQIQVLENIGVIKLNQNKPEEKTTKARIHVLEDVSIRVLNESKFKEKKIVNKPEIQVLENFGIKQMIRTKLEEIKIPKNAQFQTLENFEVKKQTQVIALAKNSVFSLKKTLKIDKTEPVEISRVPVFVFDDAKSEESTEIDLSRSRKSSVTENRDPIREYFIFVSSI